MYTGNPAPVIFTPRSKSIRLNFLQRSQWHIASSGRFGFSPPSLTTTLSEASFPSGTSSQGIFGIVRRRSINFCCISFNSRSSNFDSSFNAATLSFIAFASSFLPSFIRAPIWAAFFLPSWSSLSSFC